MSQFKVGDKVRAFGVDGVVMEIDETASFLSVRVAVKNNQMVWFSGDGKYDMWHAEPSLVLIERPKKMVTETVEGWLNISKDGKRGSFWDTKEEADSWAHNRIACVHLTGSYTVEE